MTIRYYSYFGGEENHVKVMFGEDITKQNWKDIILNKEFGDNDITITEEHEHYELFGGIIEGHRWSYEKYVSFDKHSNRAEVELSPGALGYYVLTET